MEFELFGALRPIGIEWGSALMLALLLGLLVTGMPLAFVTLLVALIFALGWFGPSAVGLIVSRIYSFVGSYVFVAVPMFVLMASVLDRSGIARDLFDAMKLLGGRIRGALAVQTLGVAVLLAAMSGIIGGEIVLLGLLALPQMLRLGYDRSLAIGVVCAGGALGTMVPPSIVLIIYGLTANVSISDLFTSAFTPGLMLASFYAIYVLTRAALNPALAPLPGEPIPPRPGARSLSAAAVEDVSPDMSLGRLLVGLALPALVIVVVLGSIYGGIASVTEASGLGVAGVIASTAVRGELTLGLLRDAALRTLSTCGMIVWIGIGASALIGVYNLMGGNRFVEGALLGVSEDPLVILLIMMVILIVLGLFLDWVGIALLTMPIFVPIVTELGYDPVWFGVLFAMNMQVSFLSPPFGPAAFYLKSVAPPDISLADIFKALVPFICLQILALALLIAFPEIALWWRAD